MNKKADCDNVLTAKIISGNKTAFKEVYSKHWKGIFVIAYSFLKSKEEAEDAVQDIFVNKFEIKIFNSKRYKTINTHGTGCTLSSAITTFLSCGKTIKKSCEQGIKYVNSGIKTNLNYGKGHGPINHLNAIYIDRKFK